ncbi:MAG: hypothetical protein MI810_07425 [Flavobacteriales bacterium]|nr:hypothetical protein [Flavobacteriales bacterium]
MSSQVSLLVGIGIFVIILLALKLGFNKFDKSRKGSLHSDVVDFKTACKQNNIFEVNRLGARIVNNPYLTLEIFRKILLEYKDFKKDQTPPKKALEKFDDAIHTRRFNWGLYAHRFKDPEEYKKAKEDIVNFHE